MPRRATAVLFADLDGTVRHGLAQLGRFVNTPGDVVVFPEAVDRMREWKAAGGRIITVTNQGGVALGHVSPADAGAALMRTVELSEGLVDVVSMCTHHPAAADPEQASCWCRKPSPGLVFDGLRHLINDRHPEFYPPKLALMVGDRPEDEECARRAGVRFTWAADWRAAAPPH
jgi:D-glycero-D-manno-heptose 1,7-bisphosphate phosphatase